MRRSTRTLACNKTSLDEFRWEYIPFGGGPKICLGQQLALLETGYATVRLLQEFAHISSIGANEFVENFAMASTSGRECKVKLDR